MIYRILNIIVIIISLFVVSFLTVFWIGSNKQFEELRSSFFIFFVNRFLLNFIGILFSLGIVYLFGRIIGAKREIKKELLINLIVLTIFSMGMIIFVFANT